MTAEDDDACRHREPHASDVGVPELTPTVYARWRASELGRITEGLEHDVIVALLGDVSGKAVLEIGCGDGKLAVEMARRGAHVTAIDTSEAMLAAARERARASGRQVDFLVAPAQSLPFDADRFDVVVANTILCFVKDAKPAFAEIARVLHPGGYLVIGELGKWSTWAFERRIRALLGSRLWRRGIFRTPGELAALARGARLVPRQIRGAVYFPRWTWIARWMAPYDKSIGRATLFGAAFLALRADRPAASRKTEA